VIARGRLLRWIATAGLLGLVLLLVDWRAIAAVLAGAEPAWVALAMIAAVLDRLALNRRYQLLLAPRGIRIGYWRLFRIQLAANCLGAFLPSSVGVDALRVAALCRRGEPAAAVVAATLVDRATIALASLLLAAVAVVALAGTRLPDGVAAAVIVGALLAGAGCLALLAPAVRAAVRDRLLARLPAPAGRLLGEIAGAALAYRHARRLALPVSGWTLVVLALRLAFAKALLLACGVDLAWSALLVVMPVLWVLVMLPITVGGFGVQEIGYVTLLAAHGVAPAVAVAASLLEHAIVRVVSLPGVLFAADLHVARAARGDAGASAKGSAPDAFRVRAPTAEPRADV